jgi:hypothetical protein
MIPGPYQNLNSRAEKHNVYQSGISFMVLKSLIILKSYLMMEFSADSQGCNFAIILIYVVLE